MGEAAGVARAGGKKEKLQWHQRQRQGEEGAENQEGTQASHDNPAKVVPFSRRFTICRS
jgi:hypothetical protein